MARPIQSADRSLGALTGLEQSSASLAHKCDQHYRNLGDPQQGLQTDMLRKKTNYNLLPSVARSAGEPLLLLVPDFPCLVFTATPSQFSDVTIFQAMF